MLFSGDKIFSQNWHFTCQHSAVIEPNSVVRNEYKFNVQCSKQWHCKVIHSISIAYVGLAPSRAELYLSFFIFSLLFYAMDVVAGGEWDMT
jgi:hypothetical protein